MLVDQLAQTKAFLQTKTSIIPSVGIVLGSGLGSLAESLDEAISIPYATIPNFPKSTVEGHAGELIFGKLGNKEIVLMAGRFHYYEGYDMKEITFPIRLMKILGVETLILSNAAGSMNPTHQIGDIVFINDHINLFPESPLRGKNDEKLGVRFLDMSEPYDRKLIAQAKVIAEENDISFHTGVYVGLTGPTFETKAEYKWLHTIGGDVVGMSTVPEVIVALHGGMRVFAASIVTDLGNSENLVPITHEEVLGAANAAAPKLTKIVKALIDFI